MIWFRRVLTIVFSAYLTFSHAGDLKEKEWFAKVNDVPLKRSYIDFVVESREAQVSPLSENAVTNNNVEQHALKDILITQLLAQEAKNVGLIDQPRVQQEIEVAHDTLIAQLYVQSLASEFVVDETSLREAFENSHNNQQYRLKYYYFDSFSKAQNTLANIKSNEKLKHGVADSMSDEVETTSWVDRYSLTQELFEAIEKLQIGEYIAAIHQVDAEQWAIIQVAGKEVFPKPTFEEARLILEEDLKKEYIQSRIAELVSKSSIRFSDKRTLKADWYE